MSPHGGSPVSAEAASSVAFQTVNWPSKQLPDWDATVLAQLSTACEKAEPDRTLAIGQVVVTWFPERLHRAWRGESPVTPCRLVDFSQRQRLALASLSLNIGVLRQAVLFMRSYVLVPAELQSRLSQAALVQLGCISDDSRLLTLAARAAHQTWGPAELETHIRAELEPGVTLASRRGRPAMPQLLKSVGKVQRSSQHLVRTRSSIPTLPEGTKLEALDRLTRVINQLQGVVEALRRAEVS
jgi:hypothetical protein